MTCRPPRKRRRRTAWRRSPRTPCSARISPLPRRKRRKSQMAPRRSPRTPFPARISPPPRRKSQMAPRRSPRTPFSARISPPPRRKRRKNQMAPRRSPRTPFSARISPPPRRKRRKNQMAPRRSPRSSIASRPNPRFERDLRAHNERPGFHARPLLYRSGITRQPVAFENIDHALRDIEQGCGSRLRDAEIGDEPARGAAVRDSDRVTRKPLVPFAHPQGYRLITFTPGRNKMPLVLLTRSDALRIARMQLRDREALPLAEGYFRKLRLDAIAVRGKPERRTRQLHGRAGTAERARDEVQLGHVAAVAREQFPKNFAAMHSLRAPARIERDVVPALQPACHVPVGFTMADIKDNRSRLRGLTHQSVLPTAMSGASGCLMPTIW